jgi:hypothetical protein
MRQRLGDAASVYLVEAYLKTYKRREAPWTNNIVLTTASHRPPRPLRDHPRAYPGSPHVSPATPCNRRELVRFHSRSTQLARSSLVPHDGKEPPGMDLRMSVYR